MSIFKFPAVVCQELDALIAEFWWGSQGDTQKVHCVNFQEFNDALLAKQSWRDLIHSGSHWQIMGGEGVRVWVDRWLPSLPLGHHEPLGEVSVTPNMRVSSLIAPSSQEWDVGFLQPVISMANHEAILATPIDDPRRKDLFVWAANKNGRYSVKSGYRWLQSRSLAVRDHRLPGARSVPREVWRGIWHLEVPPKIRLFFWLSVHNGLPTHAALFKRRVSPSPLCPIFHCDDETIEHLFLRCSWVQAIWFGGALTYRVDGASIQSWVLWLQAVLFSNMGSNLDRTWVQSYIALTCWCI
ncbi:hypothetical protein PS2_034172 [Malus domestica]